MRASNGLPLLPGVMTPSDVIAARAAGFTEMKLFPAQQAGGIGMLKAMGGPFPDVTFCPTGGITAATAADFLALPNVACVGGSWLTPPEAVAAGDWERVTSVARDAARLHRPASRRKVVQTSNRPLAKSRTDDRDRPFSCGWASRRQSQQCSGCCR